MLPFTTTFSTGVRDALIPTGLACVLTGSYSFELVYLKLSFELPEAWARHSDYSFEDFNVYELISIPLDESKFQEILSASFSNFRRTCDVESWALLDVDASTNTRHKWILDKNYKLRNKLFNTS